MNDRDKRHSSGIAEEYFSFKNDDNDESIVNISNSSKYSNQYNLNNHRLSFFQS